MLLDQIDSVNVSHVFSKNMRSSCLVWTNCTWPNNAFMLVQLVDFEESLSCKDFFTFVTFVCGGGGVMSIPNMSGEASLIDCFKVTSITRMQYI